MPRSRHSATRVSLCLRSGRGVRGMSVCLRFSAVQKRNVCMMSSV